MPDGVLACAVCDVLLASLCAAGFSLVLPSLVSVLIG